MARRGTRADLDAAIAKTVAAGWTLRARGDRHAEFEVPGSGEGLTVAVASDGQMRSERTVVRRRSHFHRNMLVLILGLAAFAVLIAAAAMLTGGPTGAAKAQWDIARVSVSRDAHDYDAAVADGNSSDRLLALTHLRAHCHDAEGTAHVPGYEAETIVRSLCTAAGFGLPIP